MKGDRAIEEQGFTIVEPKKRRYRKKDAQIGKPLPAIASPSNRVRVTYLKRRHEVLISAKFVRSDGLVVAQEAFPIHLGRLLRDLGLTPELIADARLQQKVRDECVAILEEDEEEEAVVVH